VVCVPSFVAIVRIASLLIWQQLADGANDSKPRFAAPHAVVGFGEERRQMSYPSLRTDLRPSLFLGVAGGQQN
jgi:hypothetical protein